MFPFLVLAQASLAQGVGMEVWKLDPLEAVFRDTLPVERRVDPIDVAAGEVAEWQVVVRVAQGATVTAKVGTLKQVDGEGTLKKAKCRWVGYAKVLKPPTWVSSTQLRKIPGDFPDPLLDDPEVALKAGETQAIWVDAAIPKGTPAGLYRGEVTVSAGKERVKVPIEARVYPVFVGKNRLKVTNWFFPGQPCWTVPTKKGETQEDAQLRILATALAEHRANIGLVSPLNTAVFGIDKSGEMTVDFKPFDKRVKAMMKAGLVGRIEGDGMGTREGWAKPNLGIIKAIENGKVVQKILPAADPAVEKFYAWYFPKLLAHLKEKGWDKIYYQHVIDEPCDDNVDSYRVLREIAKKYLPGIPRLDTTCGTKFSDLQDVASPELDFLNENYDLFKKFQASGKELWFYTCWKPQGEYANRLIEEPLIKTRLLHWIGYKYGTTGYLHWGWNVWSYNEYNGSKKDQFTHDYSPGGDAWVVYPGKDGVLLCSRRSEAMRDGIADHELLSMLGDRDPAKAKSVAGKIVLAMDKYVLDAAAFRAARKELLEALSK
jgi:hypothetical protein